MSKKEDYLCQEIARKKYVGLMEKLAKIAQNEKKNVFFDDDKLKPEHFVSLYGVTSAFRTSLSRDVVSRIFIFRTEVGDVDVRYWMKYICTFNYLTNKEKEKK
jgi:hypothetical protein